ncbi:hypothetical protein GCM10009001_29740 [Virgibacillus siamensis]|uniref:Uncharacterized protein n=1 Tax=Virgibacillus siamensis TaxID=480071 RepID=A0ABP3RMV1_9BACI
MTKSIKWGFITIKNDYPRMIKSQYIHHHKLEVSPTSSEDAPSKELKEFPKLKIVYFFLGIFLIFSQSVSLNPAF